jgi:hypothetical protein
MSKHRTLVTLSLLFAVACSADDVTHPPLDSSKLSTVADRFSATSFTGNITLLPATATLAVGSTLALNGSITLANGVDLTSVLGPEATAMSSDTTIATVSDRGIVTGIREGVDTITVQLGLVSATSIITVGKATSSPTAVSITLLPVTATLAVGSSLALNGNIKGTDGVDLTAVLGPEATLRSSDTTIATVSNLGLVTGLRNGVDTIIAQVGSLSQTSIITVVGGSSGSTSPSQPSSGSGSPLSGLALVSDDYSKYGSTQDLLANISSNIGGTGSPSTALYTDGVNPQLAELDKTVTYNGHATVKYNQPGGVANSPELWVGLRQTLSHLWLRAKVRFSPGFTTTGTLANSANAYKLLGWGWNAYDGSGRLEISNTNQYQLYWNVQDKNTGTLIGGGVYGIGGNITTEWSDGGWYDYIIEVDFSQAITGIARLWMAKDGETPVLRTVSSSTMQGGAALPGLTEVMLGMNFNQVRTAGQTQALWFGEWEVVDGSQYANPYNVSGV